MTARGVAGQHDLRCIEVPLFGVSKYPSKRAAGIFNRGWSEGIASHPVLDINHAPSLFKKRKELQHACFLGAEYPSTAVNIHKRRCRRLAFVRIPDVELKLCIVCDGVDDIRLYPVAGTGF